MKKILVAIDFSDLTDKVIETGKKLTKQFNSDMTIVHTEVIENYLVTDEFTQSYSLESIEERKKFTKKTMDEIKEKFCEESIKIDTLLITGPTVENIVKLIEEKNFDLLIIGSHKHGKFYNFFIGSIHETLLHKVNIPVLVIPQNCK